MKKLLYTGLIASSMLLSGCSDFLNVPNTALITEADYYKTDNDLFRTLTTSYSTLGDVRMYSQDYFLQRDLLSDDVYTPEPAPDFSNNAQFNFAQESQVIYGMWERLYKGIRRANNVIKNTPERIINAENVARAKAEAKVLRAYYYFHMANMWRSFPLRTEDNLDEHVVEQTSREEVMDFIIADLQEVLVEDILPVTNSGEMYHEKGRVTKGFALSLLGKMFLFESDFANAEKYLKQVIDLNTYSLVEAPEDIWTIRNKNNEIGNENIFEAQFNAKVGGGSLPWFDDGPTASEGTLRLLFLESNSYGGYLNLIPTEDLINQYQPGDKRLQAFIRQKGEEIIWDPGKIYDKDQPVIQKGVTSKPEAGGGNDENFVLMRYADVLLMYAEALIQQNKNLTDAVKYIDMVRERAFGVNFNPTNPNSSATVLFKLLREERRRELCFECHRFQDLRRWGMLSEVLGDRFKEGKEYYPVPLAEIDKAGGILVQDPNY